MTRHWKLGIAVFLAIAAAGLVVCIYLQRLKRNKLAQAANVTRSRAETGDAKAQFYLASMYFYGKGVPQDYSEAARWYRKAAEQGDSMAELGMGSLYYNGKGVPQGYSESARWYRKAAEQGNLKGQCDLASMYYDGKGVPQDYAESARWYRKAAEQGDAGSQLELGFMYKVAQGVQQDYSEAIRWYRKAASQGNAEAEYNLGYMYYSGTGLPQDTREAVRWYRKSANHGYPDAQRALQVLERKSTTATAIEYLKFIVALVGGLIFTLDFLLSGRSFRKSLHAPSLGVVSLCYAGLSFYGITHDDMRYSTYRNLFGWARGILIAMVIVIGITMIFAKPKKVEAE